MQGAFVRRKGGEEVDGYKARIGVCDDRPRPCEQQIKSQDQIDFDTIRNNLLN